MTNIETIQKTLFEPDDIIELRLIKGKAPKAEIKRLWTLAEDLPAMSDTLQDYNNNGYNVFYGPNPRKEFGISGDANVKLARCLFADFDGLSAGDGCGIFEFVHTDIFLAGLPEETLAVYSGHGVHCYWKLEDPILDLTIWKATQEKLNKKLKSDPAIKNYERFMRMPGYKNTKKKPFTDCFICWETSKCEPPK